MGLIFEFAEKKPKTSLVILILMLTTVLSIGCYGFINRVDHLQGQELTETWILFIVTTFCLSGWILCIISALIMEIFDNKKGVKHEKD